MEPCPSIEFLNSILVKPQLQTVLFNVGDAPGHVMRMPQGEGIGGISSNRWSPGQQAARCTNIHSISILMMIIGTVIY